MRRETSSFSTVECASWREFEYEHLLDKLEGPTGKVVFRGQADSDRYLDTSLVRLVRRSNRDLSPEAVEDAIIHACKLFAEGMRDLGINPVLARDNLTVQSLAQHHGLPTCLLDWSLSPYTAAYFAFSRPAPEAELDDNTEPRVAIWMLNTEHRLLTAVEEDEDKMETLLLFRPDYYYNERMKNQLGLFTVLRSKKDWTIEDYITSNLRYGETSPLTKFIMPAGDYDAVRQQLAYMGINDGRLFPSLDYLANHVKQEVEKFVYRELPKTDFSPPVRENSLLRYVLDRLVTAPPLRDTPGQTIRKLVGSHRRR